MRLEKIGIERLTEMDKLGSVAFTYAINDADLNRDVNDPNMQEILNSCERWGMIDEKTDKLMGGMILLDYQTRIGDSWLPLCGVGGVATLPEFRREGVIRSVFKEVLPHMYERGMAMSGLYPFSHAFYRKFGYEQAGGLNTSTVPLDQLRAFPAPDEVRLIDNDRDMLAARVIYEKFACARDITMRRHVDSQWKRIMGGDAYKDRVYKYLLLRNTDMGSEPCAYIAFSPEDKDGQRIAAAREAAYLDADALRRVLGFMSTFFPHYSKVRIPLPGDVNLGTMCVNSYEVSDNVHYGYMLRAINAKTLLEKQPLTPALRQLAAVMPQHFSLALTDEFIPQNTGKYEISIGADGVKCEQLPFGDADMSMDIRVFTQLVTGSISLGQAACNAGFTMVEGNIAAEMLFVKRPQYIVDHY